MTEPAPWLWASGPRWTNGELNPFVDAPGLPKPVATLIKNHTRTYARLVQARDAYQRADVDFQAAAARDRATVAELAERDPDAALPDPAELLAAQQALAAAKREVQARTDAVVAAEDRIRKAFAFHADKWLPQIHEAMAAASGTIDDHLEGVAAALEERARLRTIAQILTNPRQAKYPGRGAYARSEQAWVTRARAELAGQVDAPAMSDGPSWVRAAQADPRANPGPTGHFHDVLGRGLGAT